MVKNSIKIYARLKQENPANTASYEIFKTEKNDSIITFRFDHVESSNNSFPFYRFKKYFETKSLDYYYLKNYRFENVFDQTSTQTQLFETTAKPVVNSVIEGFNGTIFAYGQTGSGKTYTITGSSNDYQERGIIPRSIEEIFDFINKTPDKYTIYISYLEIYNEVGYDLLNPKTQVSHLEELPKVILLEDGKGESHIRNLTVQRVCSEQEAMRLLFLGDTNRTITETPMNVYSSRSHCIFTIFINSRNTTSGKIRRSKLNLVDLAGSERICKSNISGTPLSEAKYINLSLHYLEQVILALSKKKSHIPFRNSMLTYVLKDSLSGNCKTVLLATLNVNKENIEETIATCKFAQRVAEVDMEALINDEIDPQQEIECLKTEIESLRRQLVQQSRFKVSGSLTKEEKQRWKNVINNYLDDSKEEIPLKNFDMRLIKYSFKLLKEAVKSREEQKIKLQSTESNKQELIEQYKNVIKQKEDEIFTLKSLLCSNVKSQPNSVSCFESGSSMFHSSLEQEKENIHPGSDSFTLSPGQKVAFEVFMANSKNTSELDYYTEAIQDIFEIAKKLTAVVEQCQNNILAVRRKYDGRAANKAISKDLDFELQNQQTLYRNSLKKLHELKTKTENLTRGLENAKMKVLDRFKIWYDNISYGDGTPENFNNKNNKKINNVGILKVPGNSSNSMNSGKKLADNSCINKEKSTNRPKSPGNSMIPKFKYRRRLDDSTDTEQSFVSDVYNSYAKKQKSTVRPKSPASSLIPKFQYRRRLDDSTDTEQSFVSDVSNSYAKKQKSTVRPKSPASSLIPKFQHRRRLDDSSDTEETCVSDDSKCEPRPTSSRIPRRNRKSDKFGKSDSEEHRDIFKNVFEENSRSKTTNLLESTNCALETLETKTDTSSCGSFTKTCTKEGEKENEISNNHSNPKSELVTLPNAVEKQSDDFCSKVVDHLCRSSKTVNFDEESSKIELKSTFSSTNHKYKEIPKKCEENSSNFNDRRVQEEEYQCPFDYRNNIGKIRIPHKHSHHHCDSLRKESEKSNPLRVEKSNSHHDCKNNPFQNIPKGPQKPEHLKHSSISDYNTRTASPKTAPSDSRKLDTVYQMIMGYDRNVQHTAAPRPYSADSPKMPLYYHKGHPKHRIGVSHANNNRSPLRPSNKSSSSYYTNYYLEDPKQFSKIPESSSDEYIEDQETEELLWEENLTSLERKRNPRFAGSRLQTTNNGLGLRRGISPQRANRMNDESCTSASGSANQKQIDYGSPHTINKRRVNSPTNFHRGRTNVDLLNYSKTRHSTLFSPEDSLEFRMFIGTIPLTGDSDVDEEIVKFYRTKFV